MFNAAIAPTTGGKDAIIDYNVGGPKLLPEIRAQVAGDPHRELKLARSAAPHETCEPPPEDPYCRWGDYAAATTDPTRPDVVWGTNEFTAPLSQDPFGLHWGTQNFALAIHGSRTAADLSRSDPNE